MENRRCDSRREDVEFCGIRTCTPRMVRLLERVRRFAALDAPILIQGETGTGKELVAHALHALSTRAGKPLVTVDCGAIPESLMESELFGHERGAFTGADRPYAGRIAAASGGTLFLDEINSMSLAIQMKLLRFLETRELCRIGQPRALRVDIRLIGASNVPLEQLVEAGQMRADFFYRLDVLRLDLPPLRERLADVRLLARQFLAEDALAQRCGITDVTDELLAQLRAHDWPGNVRELRSVLGRAIVFAGQDSDILRPDVLTDCLAYPRRPAAHEQRPLPPFRAWVREREREYFSDLVMRYKTTAQQAAASGLPQRTLYRKLRSLGLSAPPGQRRGAGDVSSQTGRELHVAGTGGSRVLREPPAAFSAPPFGRSRHGRPTA